MRIPILLLAAALPLGGCVTMSAAEIGALMDRVNARIVTADELAHKFCPSLAVVNASAKATACAAKASGETQGRLNRVIAYGRAFCENPTSTSAASLVANVGTGIRAVLAADSAGCGAP